MNLAISMWSYFHPWREGRLDIPGFIHAAKDAGADGVELLDFFYNDPGTDRVALFHSDDRQVIEKREAAKQALQETELPVPIFSVAQNLAKPSAEDREIELEKIRFGIGEALEYGAKTVRVFAGDISEGITFEQARSWIVEGLTAASIEANQAGIRLALENHGKLAGRSDQVAGLIAEVRQASGNDALGANPDTGNFMLVNEPSHDAVARLASLAYMVHFKDFKHGDGPFEALNGEKFVGAAVGEGEVDLVACVSALRNSGFHGWLSIEYEGEEDPLTAVPKAVANARTLIGTNLTKN